jgi:uncharacterized protein
VVFVVGVVFWLKSKARMLEREEDDEVKSRVRPVEDMVRCGVCGVNLPRSEAILSQGKLYCCDEHRRLGA